jgi:predicted RNA binding protein YcfA (HicA-like mRNA interferase family)
MKPMKRREVVKKLCDHGCWLDRTTAGSHDKWRCPCGTHTAMVPRHRGDIEAGTCRGIQRTMSCLEKGWLQ